MPFFVCTFSIIFVMQERPFKANPVQEFNVQCQNPESSMPSQCSKLRVHILVAVCTGVETCAPSVFMLFSNFRQEYSE